MDPRSYHCDAICRGHESPREQDIVSGVGDEEAEDDCRDGRVDGEGELLDRVGELGGHVYGLRRRVAVSKMKHVAKHANNPLTLSHPE